MENTFSDGVFIEVELIARPVPPGTKSTRWLAEHPEYTPPPETPPAEHPPEQPTDTKSE